MPLPSMALALAILGGAAGLAGLAYSLIGVVEFFVGLRFGKQITRVKQQSAEPA